MCSYYGHKEDFDVASSLFSTSYCSIFRQTFKLPINRVVKILTSNWIVQSLRRYVYVPFINMWYNDPRFSTIVIVLITRDEKFFTTQQRIGRDDPANLPYLFVHYMYKRFVGR